VLEERGTESQHTAGITRRRVGEGCHPPSIIIPQIGHAALFIGKRYGAVQHSTQRILDLT
jgi:hypothetical protein